MLKLKKLYVSATSKIHLLDRLLGPLSIYET